jgi:hypothetical protein
LLVPLLAQVSSGSANADVLYEAAVARGTTWWTDMEALLRLCTPIAQAIEQVQGDTPLLSQMRELWVQLSDHVAAWWQAPETPAAAKRGGSLPMLFMQRMAKSWHPAASPAYVLDPIYFKQRASGKWGPNFEAIQVRPSMGQPTV